MTEKDHAKSDRIQSKENTDRNKDPETKKTLKANKPRSRPLCCLPFDSPLQMKRDTKISWASLNGLLLKPWFQDGLWPPLLPPWFIVKVEGRSLRIFSKFSVCSFSRPTFSLSISTRWEQQRTQKPLCLWLLSYPSVTPPFSRPWPFSHEHSCREMSWIFFYQSILEVKDEDWVRVLTCWRMPVTDMGVSSCLTMQACHPRGSCLQLIKLRKHFKGFTCSQLEVPSWSDAILHLE